MSAATLLVLVDGRFPAGAHAHSGGVEVLVRRGELHDVASLRSFLQGRLATNGFVDATIAADAIIDDENNASNWPRLDREANARIASPAQRAVSRTLGRRLARTAARCWPDARLDQASRVHPDGPHFPVALGAAGCAGGLDADDVAIAAVYASIASPATAAVRLLGLDPVAVHTVLAALAPEMERVAHRAVAAIREHGLSDTPAPCAPRSEIAAEHHLRLEGRLFAS